ncbi:PAS domain S-box protein [Aureimonas phyllosphaerae]|uniref:histidine kinase n=1 Tax=Aureimonas phyllosphaerae TaxID=1166078 RepID=A0A7W6FUN1_9HYPH|nr:PAS domain S-box protein [Aureimonas phyllosphaerae]MBB3936419.1 PAS domain S-box-containing protein [Aureimonas phyllosphaerae]MBB3960717.1 PAS domain S-box-containing protein [Aureimonas phyllosphaerae]SFF30613.1 PAS domain S-box-containing protein [Aureimonas phyllosphaerae]
MVLPLEERGAIGALIGSRNWSDFPLGPPAAWPPALRTAVDLLLSSHAQIVLFWGPDYHAFYNEAYAPTIGTKHPRAFGRPARENWSELWDDLGPLLAGVVRTGETVSAKDRPFQIERHGFREEVYFDISYSPVHGEGGDVAGVLCIVSETTGRVVGERRLAESESRFRNMADHAPVMLWVTDPEGRCTYLNRSWYETTGQTPEAAEGFGWLDATHPDDAEEAGRVFRRANAAHEAFRLEYRLRHRDGRYRWAIDAASPRFDETGAFLGFVGSVIDIDERRAGEDRLRASEAGFQAIANTIDQMVWTTLPDGFHDYYNDRWYEFTGMPHGSTDGEAWNGMFHPDDQERAWGVWRRCLATGEPYHIEYRLRHRSGEYRWVLGRAQAMRDAAGRIIRWFGTCTDIHDFKLEEERRAFLLELSDTLLGHPDPTSVESTTTRLLGQRLRVARCGYGDVDASGEIVRVARDWTRSPEVTSLAGENRILRKFGPTAIEELRAGRTLTVEDVRRDPRIGERFLETWDGIGCQALIVVPMLRDGSLRSILYLHEPSPRRWTPDEIRLCAEVAARTREALERARAEAALIELNASLEERVRERTAELERTSEVLRQAQKMEAVGQLTGGIAHDFNNMLSVIIGSLDLLGRRLPDGEARLRRYAENAMEGARRAATLTHRLLAFSRQQPLNPQAVDLNKLVSGMSELMRRTLSGNIRLETVLGGGLWSCSVDANQLENVIVNLAVNARDAMPDGGRLTIETQNAHLDDRYAAADIGIVPGQYVLVAVTDTGTGMSPEVMAKAFDPFFTTKEIGKGTGLGLSQVYGFVKQSEGHVKIYSEPGRGTSVKIYLPRLVGEHDVTDQIAAALPELTDPSAELILVVEDDESVRRVTIEAVQELGYRTLEAEGAAEALRLLAQRADIDLLFTDVVMPDIDGRMLAEEARRARPDLRVVFTTGYTRNAIVHHGVLDAGVRLLTKPFSLEDLAMKLRDALDDT